MKCEMNYIRRGAKVTIIFSMWSSGQATTWDVCSSLSVHKGHYFSSIFAFILKSNLSFANIKYIRNQICNSSPVLETFIKPKETLTTRHLYFIIIINQICNFLWFLVFFFGGGGGYLFCDFIDFIFIYIYIYIYMCVCVCGLFG